MEYRDAIKSKGTNTVYKFYCLRLFVAVYKLVISFFDELSSWYISVPSGTNDGLHVCTRVKLDIVGCINAMTCVLMDRTKFKSRKVKHLNTTIFAVAHINLFIVQCFSTETLLSGCLHLAWIQCT